MRIASPQDLAPLAPFGTLLGASMSLIDREMRVHWGSQPVGWTSCEGSHCYASKWGRSDRCPDCLPVLVFRTGEPASGWRERRRPGGPPLALWVQALPVHDTTGALQWVLEFALPVSLPAGGVGAMQPSGRLASAAGSPFVVLDTADRIVSWNPAATATFGWELDEVLGRRVDMLIPRDRISEKVWINERIREHGEVTRLRTERLARDGRRVPVLLSATALRDEVGEPLGRSTVYEDLSALEQLRRRVQTQDQLLAHINREAADAIIGLDAEGRVSSWNRGAQQTFGREAEELLGQHPDGLLPRADLVGLLERVRVEGTLRGLAMEWRGPGGRPIPVEVTATLLRAGEEQAQGVALVVRDSSAQQRLARQMIRSEKLAVVGSLAAGLAHEIGTPLNVISATVEFMLLDLAAKDPHRADLSSIVAETDRIGSLVRELLSFARGTGTPREAVPLDGAAQRVLRLLRGPAERKQVSLEFRLTGGLCVLAVPDELHQLLLNLLLNAVEAVHTGGRVCLDAAAAEESSGAAPGQVALRVHDDGPGVDPALVERIFDPFFTTRAEGTGLGLAVCSRIVAACGGDLRVGPGPLGGACFTALLPAAEDRP